MVLFFYLALVQALLEPCVLRFGKKKKSCTIGSSLEKSQRDERIGKTYPITRQSRSLAQLPEQKRRLQGVCIEICEYLDGNFELY